MAPGRLVEAWLHLLGVFQNNGSFAREALVRCDICNKLVFEDIPYSRVFAEIVVLCDH